VGRSTLAEDPAWAQGIADPQALQQAAMAQLTAQGEKPTPVKVQQFLHPVQSSRDIRAALQRIRAAGGQAEYLSADVTDAAAVRAQLKPLTDRFGPVTGIIHGAGVLADKHIEKKTWAEIQTVYSTKIDGLASLLSVVDPAQLTHLALFSSAAGFYGNTGQSDYAAANEILNKAAIRFKQRYPASQVVSFNWGPWDGGMVTPELKQMFTRRGVYVIPLAAGAALFVNELCAASNRCPQILVGNEMAGSPAPSQESIAKKPVTHKNL
jgi:NAD(P)-dependent dehydrogenase (short-subunit alcohol dehydrogenase family)